MQEPSAIDCTIYRLSVEADIGLSVAEDIGLSVAGAIGLSAAGAIGWRSYRAISGYTSQEPMSYWAICCISVAGAIGYRLQ